MNANGYALDHEKYEGIIRFFSLSLLVKFTQLTFNLTVIQYFSRGVFLTTCYDQTYQKYITFHMQYNHTINWLSDQPSESTILSFPPCK